MINLLVILFNPNTDIRYFVRIDQGQKKKKIFVDSTIKTHITHAIIVEVRRNKVRLGGKIGLLEPSNNLLTIVVLVL